MRNNFNNIYFMNEFYVYAYLDPRKEGKFKYDDYEFDYEPFYIGKGKNSRILRHLNFNIGNNGLKKNKIKKIIDIGMKPILIKIKENLSNSDALTLEEELINKIGRLIRKTGPLLNFTKGGETYLGYKHKEDHLKKLNKSVIKYDLIGNKLEEYESVKEAGEKNNVCSQTISQVCSGKIKILNDNFIFLYSDDKFKKRKRDKKQYPVERIDYDGNILEYQSLTEASLDNKINLSKINSVCMGKRFHTGGYFWRYKSHPDKTLFDETILNNYKKYIELMDVEIEFENFIYKNILHLIKEKGLRTNTILKILNT
jgi:hypothetical protein